MDVKNPAEYDPNDRFHTLLRDVYTKKRDGQARNPARRGVRDDSAAIDEDEDVDARSNIPIKHAPRSKTSARSASTTDKRAVRSTQTKQTTTQTRSTARKGTSTTAPTSSPRSQHTQSSPRDNDDDGSMELDNNGSSSSESDAEFSPPSAIKTRTSARGRPRGRARRAPTTNTTATDTDMNTDAGPPIGTFSPRTNRSRPSRRPTFNSKAKASSNVDGPADIAAEQDEYGSSTDEEPMMSVPTAYFKQLQRETLWRRDVMAKAGLDGENEGNGGRGASGLDFVRD